MTRAAVRDVMQLMRKDPGASMLYETAREVATREGAKALLDGAVDRVGTGYVVSARLVSALDGGELATFRVTAANDGELIASLGELAKDVRERVGESLKSIRDTKALERVTTGSLPALKKYVEGMYLIEALDDRERGRAHAVRSRGHRLDVRDGVAPHRGIVCRPEGAAAQHRWRRSRRRTGTATG